MKNLFKHTKLILFFIFAGFLISCESGTKDLGIPEVTITFYANNGTDDYETQKLESGISSKLRKNSFEYEGYNFIGWSLVADSEQVKYPDETSVTIKEDLSLYAVWQSEDETVTITFWANTSEDDTNCIIQNVGKGTTVNLRANSFTNEGYNFIGWALKADADKSNYEDKASVKVTEDLELFALWLNTSNTGTVILHSNFGDDETITLYFDYNDKEVHIIADDIFVRENYRILGWGSSPDSKAGVLTYNYIQPWLIWQTGIPSKENKQIIHYYCIWQNEDEYTITFHPNYEGATAKNVVRTYKRTDKSKESMDVYIWEPDLFEREGYALCGWDVGAVFTDNQGHGLRISVERDMDVYAWWVEEDKCCTINYYINDGTDLETQQKKTVKIAGKNYKYGLAPNLFTREGYTFEGWLLNTPVYYKNLNNTNWARRIFDDYISDSLEINYYAAWKAEKPKLTFHANFEGSQFEDEIRILDDNNATVLNPDTKFARDHYTLIGWSTTPQDSEESSFVSITGSQAVFADFDLYAVWHENQIIKFYPGFEGAEPEYLEIEFPYNKDTELPEELFNTWKREGYYSIPYYESQGDYGRDYFYQGNTKSFNSNYTEYTAKWYYLTKVIYHSNDGTDKTFEDDAPASKYYQCKAVEDIGFSVPEGKFFLGWDTDKNSNYPSTRVWIEDKQNITIDVYAIWKPLITITIYSNLDGKGEKSSNFEKVIKWGDSYDFKDDLFPPKEGAVLYGYSLDYNGNTIDYYANVERVIKLDDAELILYAIWKDDVTLTFHENYGQNRSFTKTFHYNQRNVEVPIPEDWEHERDDELYITNGWSTSKTTISSEKLNLTKDADYYVVWRPPVDFTYYSNYPSESGLSAKTEVIKIVDRTTTKITLIDCPFEIPEGYKFMGWFVYKSTNGRTPMQPGTVREVGTYKYLYAGWEKIE